MKKSLRRKPLPVSPSLEHLRKQAKKRSRENPSLKLAAAQRDVAKEYGFRNWAELAREVVAIAKGAGSKAELLGAIRSQDLAEAIRLLDQWPMLLDVDLWPVAMFQARSPAMTRLLLARGLDPNRSSSPRKPLHFAVDQGWPDIVEELLQHGADPNIRDGEGFTPLDLYGGLVRGDPEVVRQIVETLRKAGADVNVWTAIRIGDTNRALGLLGEKPELINEGSPDLGFSPLHVASRMANGAVVGWLLDHGADVNGATPLQNTALWFVCQSGAEVMARLDVARMLISAGADVNRRCENGSTALCYGAWRGPSAMVELLLSKGAQVRIGDIQARLPLDYAKGSNVSEDKDKIVELLGRTPI
jgi:ankyrin repeat protein